jgi:hypothetical protein
MNAGQISELVVAAVSLAGAFTAYLKSRTASSTAKTANDKVDAHLSSNAHPPFEPPSGTGS